jgi:hypothetical protein
VWIDKRVASTFNNILTSIDELLRESKDRPPTWSTICYIYRYKDLWGTDTRLELDGNGKVVKVWIKPAITKFAVGRYHKLTAEQKKDVRNFLLMTHATLPVTVQRKALQHFEWVNV